MVFNQNKQEFIQYLCNYEIRGALLLYVMRKENNEDDGSAHYLQQNG